MTISFVFCFLRHFQTMVRTRLKLEIIFLKCQQLVASAHNRYFLDMLRDLATAFEEYHTAIERL